MLSQIPFSFSSSSFIAIRVFSIVNSSQSVDFSQQQRITMTTTNDFNFTFDYSLMHVIQYFTPISKEFLRFHCCFFLCLLLSLLSPPLLVLLLLLLLSFSLPIAFKWKEGILLLCLSVCSVWANNNK